VVQAVVVIQVAAKSFAGLPLTICFPRIRWRKRITPRARKIAPDYRPRIPIQAVMEAVLATLGGAAVAWPLATRAQQQGGALYAATRCKSTMIFRRLS